MAKLILALDQGTTSSRAILFDQHGNIVAKVQKEFKQIYPKAAWVEHNPDEIWQSQYQVAQELLKEKHEIAAIGITNQRETTVVWDRETGKAIYNAIVWQDRRTSKDIDKLKEQGLAELFKEKTGLILDAYFSATKIAWILNNVTFAREKAEAGKLAFGTIDSWLIYNLTKGKLHISDPSNASRTMLFNIHSLTWDDELLEILNIPKSMLASVKPSSELYGYTEVFEQAIPIAGIAGDQQAASFGQTCFNPGEAKNTYGTGCFLMLNTGQKAIASQNNLLTTIAWQKNQITYALEGSVFMAGAVVQWLRDELKIIKQASEIEELAKGLESNEGVYLVPAFAGLGAPHWDQYARGLIIGLSRGTGASHIARAALESIAFQTYDLLQAMQADSGIKLKELKVDGGAANNDFLMQFQADILNVTVQRPKITETTALGAAYLAGLAVGYWQNQEQISKQWKIDKEFKPNMTAETRAKLLKGWQKALDRSRNWVEE